MFLGHYAVAIGAKRAAPRASLGTLIAAAAFLDLVWPVLVLAGLERVAIAPGATAFTPLDFEHYPISHSLVMSVVWGAAFGGVYFLVRRDARARPNRRRRLRRVLGARARDLCGRGVRTAAAERVGDRVVGYGPVARRRARRVDRRAPLSACLSRAASAAARRRVRARRRLRA
jgi:hypothetical protein